MLTGAKRFTNCNVAGERPPVSMFVPGHNLSHHKYLQKPKDRMRTDKLRFRWNLLNR